MVHKTNRALIVIDVQNDYVGGKLPIEFPDVHESIANIGLAMDAARSKGVPVVVVQHTNPEDAPFMAINSSGAELHPVVDGRFRDHFIKKNLPDAFAGTGLDEWLRSREIDTVTVAGYMTQNCDLSTVLHGMHAGFAMEFLTDATGTLPYANRAGSASAEEIHRVMMVVMQARFAAVMSTAEWIAYLENGTTPARESIFSSNQKARAAKG